MSVMIHDDGKGEPDSWEARCEMNIGDSGSHASLRVAVYGADEKAAVKNLRAAVNDMASRLRRVKYKERIRSTRSWRGR